jgi:hypothetical protein
MGKEDSQYGKGGYCTGKGMILLLLILREVLRRYPLGVFVIYRQLRIRTNVGVSHPRPILEDKYAQLKWIKSIVDRVLLWLVRLKGGLLFQVVHLTHVIEADVWRGHIHGTITSAYHMLNNCPVA